MPYVSHTGLTDGQVTAPCACLTAEVAPVGEPAPGTDPPFSFDIRPVMLGRNLLLLEEGAPPGPSPCPTRWPSGGAVRRSAGASLGPPYAAGAADAAARRPHLGGAMVPGWWASNLTPGEGGLSDWSDDHLATLLAAGSAERAVTAGEMGLAVGHGLGLIPAEDIRPIVAHLRAVPPVDDEDPVEASDAAVPAGAVADVAPGPAPPDRKAMPGHPGTDGAALHEAACASCHRSDGTGSPGAAYPSPRSVSSVVDPDGANFVRVIARGIDGPAGDVHNVMPSLRADTNDARIAAPADHESVALAGVPLMIDAGRVVTILEGDAGVPWLIRHATWLTGAAIGAGVLAISSGGWLP